MSLIRLLSCLVLLGSPVVAAEGSKPNFLFILVDDFGQRDLGCYGSPLYETPNMDRLALSGVQFSQAYVAYPRCVPSRYAILTGKHPARVQGEKDSPHVEAPRDQTFGMALQGAGYATFYCGKWHLGDGPDQVGFGTTVAAGKAGAPRSHFAPYNVSKKGGGEKSPIEGLDDAAEGEYLTDRLTDETIRFIRRHRDEPFCAVLAHYAVHTPIEGKPHIAKRYERKLEGQDLPKEVWEPESAGENLTVQNNPVYAAMVESVDKGVGRLLALLKELELEENTVVVLASDHGGLSARGSNRGVATSNRPFRAGKGHLYEGGLRIPLLLRWPGVTRSGSVIETPVVSMDLFPTFLEIAGLPLQPKVHLDGQSLVPLLKREAEGEQTRALFWHNPAPRPSSTGDWFSSAVRIGDLKLVDFPESKTVELYDLARDPEEAKNLAQARPEDRDRLMAALDGWRKEMGVSTQAKLRQKELDRAEKAKE